MLKRIRDSISSKLVSLLDGLLEDTPEQSSSFLRLAKIKYQRQDFRGAIADLNVTLKHDSNSGDALYWRCRAKYDDGQTVPALHDALRATTLRPDDSHSYYMIGNIYLRLENYSEAQKAYSTVLELGNTHAAVYAGRGYAHYGMRQFAASLNDLNCAKTAGFNANLLNEYIEDARNELESAGLQTDQPEPE